MRDRRKRISARLPPVDLNIDQMTRTTGPLGRRGGEIRFAVLTSRPKAFRPRHSEFIRSVRHFPRTNRVPGKNGWPARTPDDDIQAAFRKLLG